MQTQSQLQTQSQSNYNMLSFEESTKKFKYFKKLQESQNDPHLEILNTQEHCEFLFNKTHYIKHFISSKLIEIKSEKPSQLDLLKLISEYMVREHMELTLEEEFKKKCIDNYNISFDDFLNLFEKGYISQKQTIDLITKNLEEKECHLLNSLNVLCTLTADIFNENDELKFNYSEKTIDTFLNYLIINNYLSPDKKFEETPLDYINRVYNLYYSDNINWKHKDLRGSNKARFIGNLLRFHSLKINGNTDTSENTLLSSILSNQLYTIVFTYMLYDFCFDRDGGLDIKPFDLTKSFESTDPNIYDLFQNTPNQVNLICFFEDQRTPCHNVRKDIQLLECLINVGMIFNAIGFSVKIVGSNFKINKYNQLEWTHTPFDIKEIYNDLMKDFPNLPFNLINVYVEVDFEA